MCATSLSPHWVKSHFSAVQNSVLYHYARCILLTKQVDVFEDIMKTIRIKRCPTLFAISSVCCLCCLFSCETDEDMKDELKTNAAIAQLKVLACEAGERAVQISLTIDDFPPALRAVLCVSAAVCYAGAGMDAYKRAYVTKAVHWDGNNMMALAAKEADTTPQFLTDVNVSTKVENLTKLQNHVNVQAHANATAIANATANA